MTKQKKPADKRRQTPRHNQIVAARAVKDAIDAQQHQTALEDTFVKTAVSFLNAEADTGLTLARIARRSPDGEQRARTRVESRQAYDTILKYLGTAGHANSETLGALEVKIKKLKEQLISLGENV